MFTITILSHLFLFFGLVSSQVELNCPSTEPEAGRRPKVVLFDAKDAEPNKDNNGTVILGQPKNRPDVIGWPSLECFHGRPVKWVYNLDFLKAGLGDTYSLTARDILDFNDPSSYSFRAELEVEVYFRDLNFLLACVPFENPCSRRVVQVFYEKKLKRYIMRLLERSQEAEPEIRPLVVELDKAISLQRQKPKAVTSGCDVNFTLTTNEEFYIYQFSPQGSIHEKPRTVPDRQTLENAYLFRETVGPSCFIGGNVECNNCENFGKENLAGRRFLPLLFVMEDPGQNLSRVLRAYNTLPTESNGMKSLIKPAWEPSDFRDMMWVDVGGNKSQIFLGETVLITCHLSPFYFSFGTQIAYKISKPEVDSKSDNLTFLEIWDEPSLLSDNRIAFANFTTDSEAFSSTSGNLTMTFFCFSPVWDSATEWGNVSKTVELSHPSLSISGDSKMYTYPLNSTFNASCTASGTPVPELEVILPANSSRVEVTKFLQPPSTIHALITIRQLDTSHLGSYSCVAHNPKGEALHSFKIRIEETAPEVNNRFLTVLISVLGSISVLFLVILIILILRFRLEKQEFRKLTEEAVRDFFDGEDPSQVPQTEVDIFYTNDKVKVHPYDRKYEVPLRQWKLHNTILGKGNFGEVRKGQVEIGQRKSVIAVKSVKSTEDIDDFRATLLELKIMSSIGHHDNIVQLVAASTEEIQKRNILIGVEFCANGNLLNYLQKRKMLFNNLVRNGRIQFPKIKFKDQEEDNQPEGTYTNLVTSDLSTIDLYRWAGQIASGMEFLEGNRVLHADLAARNILLTEDLTAKISDFGLSRDLFTSSEYTKKSQVALPWKWMAPESLRFLKFSSKSDVWSYGVTLYEIFSLGEEPYPGMVWNEEFIASLESREKLPRPERYCTRNVYEKVMAPCWELEPERRAEFENAKGFFQKSVELLTARERNLEECEEYC